MNKLERLETETELQSCWFNVLKKNYQQAKRQNQVLGFEPQS